MTEAEQMMVETKEALSPAASSSSSSEDAPMDDAVLSSGNSGDEDASSTNQSDSPMDGGGGPTGNRAKFKAAQDLRIQTVNLPPTSSTGKTKPRAHSVGSATSVGLADEDEEDGSVDGGKTPVGPAPCSTGKKRRRRTAAQIDRKYPCTYPGCTKAYGSEGSLTQHQRLKHRNQSPEPGVHAAQLNNFFLPLHRTPQGALLSRPTACTPGGTRTVTIRPAGIDGRALHGFDVSAAAVTAASLMPENDTITGEFLLHSPSQALGHARQQLRARSNSMPISFSTATSALNIAYISPGQVPPLPPSTPSSVGDSTSSSKPKSTRRSRQAGSTPRTAGAGGKPPLRRNKCRSKSESLQESGGFVMPLGFQDDIRASSADHTSSETHAAVRSFPMSANASLGGPPYDWRFAVAQAQQQSESPVSSVEEAIDSDILSVLADYDTSDTGDSMLEGMVSSHSFEDATESSYASSSGGGGGGGDDWLSQQEAQYLTMHLEKMSMIHDSPPGSIGHAHGLVAEGVDPLSLASVKMEFAAPSADPEGLSLKHDFPGVVSIDSFAVSTVDGLPFVAGEEEEEDMKDGLKLHDASVAALLGRELTDMPATGRFKQEQADTLASPPPATHPQQPTWTKELNALDTYASSGIDQAEYMDVDATSFGPLQWKATDKLRPVTSQAMYTGSVDSLTAYLQHGDKNGSFAALGDTFALDSVDYAMEEPRLSSPVIQQDL